MQKIQKVMNFAILGVEASHIFCCVLPTIFSLLSLMVGLGVIGAVPAGILNFHDVIHDWEIPIIIASGLIILLGWALHDYAQKMDCESMGPDHEVCAPRKKTTAKILKIATVLFMVNVTIYALVHVPMEGELAVHSDHAGHAHEAHDDPVMLNGEVIDESHEYYYYIKQDMMHEVDDESGHGHHDGHGH